MRHKRFVFVLIMLTLFMLVLAGCDSDSDDDDSNNAENTSVETAEITLQTSWIHEYSSSVFHVAEQDGYFAAENLEVNLVEGGFDENGFIDPVAEVLGSENVFGLSESSTLIQARAAGQPVVAILSVLQRAPSALISLESNNISVPADLIGQTITISEGGAQRNFDSFLAIQGMTSENMTIVPRTDFGIDPLLNGDVDVLSGWIINEGVMVQEAGETPTYILLSDYGIDTYSFVLFTTEDTITNNPDAVQRLVNAMVASIQATIDDPDNAITQTLTYNPDLDFDAQLRRLEATIPLMNVPGLDIGTMQPEIWQADYELLVEQGIIEEFEYEIVYDMTFINTVHNNEAGD